MIPYCDNSCSAHVSPLSSSSLSLPFRENCTFVLSLFSTQFVRSPRGSSSRLPVADALLELRALAEGQRRVSQRARLARGRPARGRRRENSPGTASPSSSTLPPVPAPSLLPSSVQERSSNAGCGCAGTLLSWVLGRKRAEKPQVACGAELLEAALVLSQRIFFS